MSYSEMLISSESGDPSSGRAVQEADLDQVGFINIFDSIFGFADCGRDGVYADWTTVELLDNGKEELSVHLIKTETIDVHHLQPFSGGLSIDDAIGPHLREVTNAFQQPIGDSRSTPTSTRDFAGSFGKDFDAQNPC